MSRSSRLRGQLFGVPVQAWELSSSQWNDAKLSNLRMEYRRFPKLPAMRTAAEYSLRAYRPGDESAWVEILAASDLGEWDRNRLDRMIAGERGTLPLQSALFAIHDGTPIATAHAELRKEPGPELSWVAVRPEHRGHGLAYLVCREVMAYAVGAGHPYLYLATQDFRLPAIRTYLQLGFEPVMADQTHPSRWEAIHSILSTRLKDAGSDRRRSGR